MQTPKTSRAHARKGQQIVDPAVWAGDDLSDQSRWTRHFSSNELADLGSMADEVLNKVGDDLNQLLKFNSNDIELGAATAVVNETRHQLQDGLGFSLLRGLPVGDWSRSKLAVVYWALGQRLGKLLPNNQAGDMLGHVTNLGKDFEHPNHRAYQTNSAMFYHNDQCDVVGLLCLQKSKAGGASKISSSLHVHNLLWQRSPKIAEALTREVYWSRLGEIGPGQDPWYTAPLFDYVDGYLCVAAGFKHIEKGHLLPDTPPLEDAVKEGMLMLNDICEETHLAMEFEPGDIQLLNNYVCLHTRSGFEDWPEPERRRHLWRLWLSVSDLRPRSAYARNWRDGVWAPQDSLNISLEAS